MERISESQSELEGRFAAEFEVGPVETFELFYRREMPALVAFAAALSGSACAEDIAQEAMLAAYRRWDVVSGLDAPAAWVPPGVREPRRFDAAAARSRGPGDPATRYAARRWTGDG